MGYKGGKHFRREVDTLMMFEISDHGLLVENYKPI